MDTFIVVQGKTIRTDWIYKIEQGIENGNRTCTIWFSVGPVGYYAFQGKDAESALRLLATHPALMN